MNWIVRLGKWLENRRIIRQPDYDILDGNIRGFVNELHAKINKENGEFKESLEFTISRLNQARENIDSHYAETLNLVIELSKKIERIDNQSASKEIALLKIRLDQMELYVGSKREPKPEHVPGMAKIG